MWQSFKALGSAQKCLKRTSNCLKRMSHIAVHDLVVKTKSPCKLGRRLHSIIIQIFVIRIRMPCSTGERKSTNHWFTKLLIATFCYWNLCSISVGSLHHAQIFRLLLKIFRAEDRYDRYINNLSLPRLRTRLWKKNAKKRYHMFHYHSVDNYWVIYALKQFRRLPKRYHQLLFNVCKVAAWFSIFSYYILGTYFMSERFSASSEVYLSSPCRLVFNPTYCVRSSVVSCSSVARRLRNF